MTADTATTEPAPPDRLTADQLQELITACLAARDFDLVIAALHAMVPIDPHRAGDIYDTIKLGCTLARSLPEEPPVPTDHASPATDHASPATERQRALTATLADGGPITTDHATELAAIVVQLAGPDSFLANDGRVADDDARLLLAQAILDRAAEPAPLDEFAQDIREKAQHAKKHNGGQPLGVWSTSEQLAVALVLSNIRFLAHAGFSVQEAAVYVAGSMSPPPADMRTWVENIRTALAEEAQQ